MVLAITMVIPMAMAIVMVILMAMAILKKRILKGFQMLENALSEVNFLQQNKFILGGSTPTQVSDGLHTHMYCMYA